MENWINDFGEYIEGKLNEMKTKYDKFWTTLKKKNLKKKLGKLAIS